MLVVMLGVYLQNVRLSGPLTFCAQRSERFGAEFKQQLAELELRLTKQIMELCVLSGAPGDARADSHAIAWTPY